MFLDGKFVKSLVYLPAEIWKGTTVNSNIIGAARPVFHLSWI